MKMKTFLFGCIAMLLFACNNGQKPELQGEFLTISKDSLFDKIKGGWAGQTIGVTYGGPVEFRFQGSYIQDYQQLPWNDTIIKWWYDNAPGLYDDIYMDLTFVDVFERLGLDAPVDSFAAQYAHAKYWLWHANQCGRYNFLNGIKPPQSGHWLNNPHADCIDFQIEADFAGLMTPGMPQVANEICDKIGHIMNYGDGWYGGVYVANLYSLAFTSNDVNYVVTEALKSIPQKSKYYKCMSDVIAWHKKYPNDWKQTWLEVERLYSEDYGCPDGVFSAFNIDAVLNSAYVVMGLLYGNGDFEKSIDISTRCGADADCNPSTVAGVLGTMMGYKNIPDKWKKQLPMVENIDFKYTTISLAKTYELGFKHALQVIERNGGKVDENNVSIKIQKPQEVQFEQSFEGHKPTQRMAIQKILEQEAGFEFEGIGFVLTGEVQVKPCTSVDYNYVTEIEVYINNQLAETVKMPARFETRKHEVCWKYQLPNQKHSVKLKIKNPDPKYNLKLNDAIIYEPV